MRLIDADALKEMKFSGGMRDDSWIIHVPLREVMENIDEAPTIGGWISVKDRLPEEENQTCWVWCAEMEEPEIDTWEGHRGETGVIYDDFGDSSGEAIEYVRSGWYYNDEQPITHWMPIPVPEPPEEVSGDAD